MPTMCMTWLLRLSNTDLERASAWVQNELDRKKLPANGSLSAVKFYLDEAAANLRQAGEAYNDALAHDEIEEEPFQCRKHGVVTCQ